MGSTRVHIAVLTIATPPGTAVAIESIVADSATAAGHDITEFEAVRDSEVAIRSQLVGWIADPEIDVVILIAGGHATTGALTPLVDQHLPGFTELVRALTDPQIAGTGISNASQVARCGSTFVFVLPPNAIAVRAAMESLILPQLDPRTEPTNLIPSLPRLTEVTRTDVTTIDANLAAEAKKLPRRTPSPTGKNVIARKVDDPTKPIDLEKLERQLALSKTTGDMTKPQIDLDKLEQQLALTRVGDKTKPMDLGKPSGTRTHSAIGVAKSVPTPAASPPQGARPTRPVAATLPSIVAKPAGSHEGSMSSPVGRRKAPSGSPPASTASTGSPSSPTAPTSTSTASPAASTASAASPASPASALPSTSSAPTASPASTVSPASALSSTSSASTPSPAGISAPSESTASPASPASPAGISTSSESTASSGSTASPASISTSTESIASSAAPASSGSRTTASTSTPPSSASSATPASPSPRVSTGSTAPPTPPASRVGSVSAAPPPIPATGMHELETIDPDELLDEPHDEPLDEPDGGETEEWPTAASIEAKRAAASPAPISSAPVAANPATTSAATSASTPSASPASAPAPIAAAKPTPISAPLSAVTVPIPASSNALLDVPYDPSEVPSLRRSKAPIFLGLLVLAIVLGGGGAYLYLKRDRAPDAAQVAQTTIDASEPDAAPAAEADPGSGSATEQATEPPPEIEIEPESVSDASAKDEKKSRSRKSRRGAKRVASADSDAANTEPATPENSDPEDEPGNAAASTGPRAEPGCAEVECVLEEYKRSCCARFKPSGEGYRPSTEASDSLQKAQIKAGIAKVRAKVIACGEQFPAKGTVKLSISVGPEGQITELSVQSAPDDGLGSCVAAAARKATFAKTESGGSFTYPFVF